MSILVYAEHDNSVLKADTLKTVAAAQKIGGDITILVVGYNCQSVAEQAAKVNGVTKVLVADNLVYEHQLAENISLLVTELAVNYDVILATALTTGKNFMPRVAALLDVAQISDITAVVSADTFVRPIYAGNAIATVQSVDDKKVITVRSTGFDAVATDGAAEIIMLDKVTNAGISSHVSDELTVSKRPDLGAASIVISGGRGMQNGDNFKLLDGIADKLGAAIGALFGGWFSGHLMSRGWSVNKARRSAIVLGCMVMLPALLLTSLAATPWMAMGLIALILFGFQTAIGNVQTLPSDYFSGKTVGTLAGISGTSAVLSVIITIQLVPMMTKGGDYTPFFILGAALVPLALISLWLGGKIEPVKRKA